MYNPKWDEEKKIVRSLYSFSNLNINWNFKNNLTYIFMTTKMVEKLQNNLKKLLTCPIQNKWSIEFCLFVKKHKKNSEVKSLFNIIK
jgi:hypothetical protein